MHHVFIVNPAAGKGKTLQMAEIIKQRFSTFNQTYEIKITESPGHAEQIAHDYAKNNSPVRIYSVGGDGTLNEVINGMAGSNAELGIIPCGTGNDAVKSIYKIWDPVELIDILPVSPSASVDLGKFNDRYFINIASIGFDAEVVLKSRLFRKMPLISGPMAYILGVLAAVIGLKKYKLRIKLSPSSVNIEKDMLLTIFANGAYYGGGMKPAPKAKVVDGVLDFCLVEAVTRSKLLRFFPVYKKGEHVNMKEVQMLTGNKAIIESDNPFPVNIDGEVFTEKQATVEILPEYLSVIIPVEMK